MADVIKKIRTPDGDLPIDYNALANKPDLDKKLNTSGGTVTGDLTIEGDLRVQGDAVETHLENVKIPQNSLTLRDGASQGLLNNEYTGIVAEKYDGANNGMLVFDKGGTAYVGDEGDLQPLATRGNVVNNNLVKWDQQNLTLVDAGESVDSIGQKIDAKAHLSHTTKQENVGYSIDVPSDSTNYAKVNKIGGMTRKCANIWDEVAEQGCLRNGDNSTYVNSELRAINHIKVLPNTTYYTNESIVVSYYNANKEWVQGSGSEFGYSVNAGTFTTPSDAHYMRFYTMSYGTTYNNDIIIAEGEPKPYEPYFEGLRSAKVTEVKSVGVNLLSEQFLIIATNASDDGNYIKFSNQFATISNTLFKPNTRYTLSYVGKIDTGNGRLAIKYTDGTVDNAIINSTSDVSVSINSNSKKTIASIYTSYGATGNVWIKKGTLMLYEGITDLPYTPHVEHILPISTAVQALDGYGLGINEKYFNSVVWESETNKKWFKRRAKQKIFDGTENFAAWTNGSTFIGVTLDGMDYDYSYGQDIRGVCSHFKILVGGQIVESALCFRQGGDMARFYFVDSSLTSVADWKNFFATQYAEGNPVVLVYGIAEEEVTDISDLITADNMIKVEPHGTLTFENEYKYNVPSMVQFYENTNELIGADEFVGDLTGTAKRAVADKEGRNIEQTYATKVEMNEKLAVSAKKTYSGIKYQEDVPNDVAKYAAVQKIGGMSYKTKNLLKPFAVGSSNWNGYTITRNADGSTTITGAATEAKEMLIDIVDVINYPVYMSAGETYTLTVTKDGVPIEIGERVDYKDAAGGTYWGWPGDTTRARALTKLYAQKTVSAGDNTTLNGVYRAILTKGNTVVPFEPYFDDLRDTKVTEIRSVGVNLFGGNSTENPQHYGDYYIDPSGSVSTNASYNCFVMPIKETTTYFLWSSADILPCSIIHFMDDNSLLGVNTALYGKKSGAIASPTGAKYMRLSVPKNSSADICINESNASYNGKYYPYVKHTLPIPEAVQALDGYGLGVSADCYNYIDWEKKQFVKRCASVDLGTLSWYSTGNRDGWYINTLSGIAKVNVGLCDKYTVIPETAIEAVADKTLQIRSDITLIRDTSITYGSQITGTLIYELATPEVTDISNLLPTEAIQVEDNGTLTFVNEFNYDVPYEVNFYDEINEIIAAKEIVGDLIGTASMAQCDATGRDIATGYVKQEPIYYHQFQVQKYKNGNLVVDMWDLGTTISFNGLKCFVLNSAGERVYLSSIQTSTGSGTIYTPDGEAVSIYYDNYPELNTIYFYDKEGAEAWSGTKYESSNGGNAITISYSRSIVDEMSISVGETTVTETGFSMLAEAAKTGGFGGLEEIARVSVNTLNFVENDYDGSGGQYGDINRLAEIALFVKVYRTDEMYAGEGLLYPIWGTGVMTDPTSPCETVAEYTSNYDGRGLVIPDNGISNLGNDFTLIFYR